MRAAAATTSTDGGRRRQVHQDETGEEGADDRADRFADVDIANALPLRWRSTAILATTGPTIPSTVAGIRKSRVTTMTVRSSQLRASGARDDVAELGVDPEAGEGQQRPQREQGADGPTGLDAVRQPATEHVAQADAAQDDADDAGPDRQRTVRPTCRATGRLETSSRMMMQRLLKNARAYGNNRAARPTIPERLLTIDSPGLAISHPCLRGIAKKPRAVHDIRPEPRPTTGYWPLSRPASDSHASGGSARKIAAYHAFRGGLRCHHSQLWGLKSYENPG